MPISNNKRGTHAINRRDSTLYVRILDTLHGPEASLANTYVFHAREDMLCDPNRNVMNNAFVTTQSQQHHQVQSLSDVGSSRRQRKKAVQ